MKEGDPASETLWFKVFLKTVEDGQSPKEETVTVTLHNIVKALQCWITSNVLNLLTVFF